MNSSNVICMPECLGAHIHFSVMMRGIKQHVFISATSVDRDARQRLSTGEAVIHVVQNMQRFVDAARAKGRDGAAESITLDENDHLLPCTEPGVP